MNKITNIAIMNRSAKNTATVAYARPFCGIRKENDRVIRLVNKLIFCDKKYKLSLEEKDNG